MGLGENRKKKKRKKEKNAQKHIITLLGLTLKYLPPLHRPHRRRRCSETRSKRKEPLKRITTSYARYARRATFRHVDVSQKSQINSSRQSFTFTSRRRPDDCSRRPGIR